MQEVLVLIVIVLAIFYLPRILGRKPVPVPSSRPFVLKGWMRMAILISFFWIAGSAAFFKPWEEKNLILFLSAGCGPVAALWGGIWVWFGYKKH